MGSLRAVLRRWLWLPSPVDLGWSDSNALGLREFTPYQAGKTWEDWTEYVRDRYPVRYFLAEAVPLWVNIWLIWPLGRLRDLFLDHLLASRRYHLLDLRGVDTLSDYRHGYLDPCEVFRLAGWASLMRWYRECPAPESTDADRDPQLAPYREALELVHYWTVTREERDRKCDQLREVVDAIETTPENQALYESALDVWLQHTRESEKLDEAMWLRLARLRPFLWD